MFNPFNTFFYPSIIINHHNKTQGHLLTIPIGLSSPATIF